MLNAQRIAASKVLWIAGIVTLSADLAFFAWAQSRGLGDRFLYPILGIMLLGFVFGIIGFDLAGSKHPIFHREKKRT